MTSRGPRTGPAPDAAVYVISVAAELTGLHPQTLRSYERMGLITPGRTGGGGRRYSERDLTLLRTIAELTAAGIGIEGVRRILDLEHQVDALRARNAELQDEVDRAKRALAASLARSPQVAVAPARPSRVPALRPAASPGEVVVWRRSR